MRAHLQFASAFAIAIAASASASAQEAPQTGANNGQGLEEIIVTAQRREENLQRAAVSISAVTGDKLTREGVTDVTQLQTMVPSLQIGSSFGPNNQFTLRGVGNLVLNVNSDTAVITNVDGIPIARASSVQGLFYDLERIEVLKGPQGTLYGRNATGGAINVITKKPDFDGPSGYINASYGNYDALNVGAALNLPVSENVAVRVAGTLSQHDGYYSDGSGDERIRAIRGTVLAKLSDTVTLTVGADYSTSGGVGSGATVFQTNRKDRIGIRDPRSGAVYASTFSLPTFALLAPLTLPDHQDNSMWGIYANLEVETSVGTITLAPAYRKTRLDFLSSAPGFYSLIDEEDVQKSVELRLVSDNDRQLQYIVGAFYMQEDNTSNVNFNHRYFGAYGVFAPTSKAVAGYARLTYKVTPEFRVSLAGRYTSDKRGNFQDVVNGLVVCPAAVFGNPATYCFGTAALPVGFTAPASWSNGAGGYLPAVPNGNGGLTLITYGGIFNEKRTFNKFNWRAGLEYDVGPESLLYASFETGFKAGGFYNSPDPDPTFGPETVKSWTFGSKNRFFDNRLQLNVEAFWLEYQNKQFSHIIPVTGGTTFATENVGKSRIRGVELDALAKVATNTTVNLNVQYLDAKEIDFVYSSLASLGPPVTGCPFSGPVAGSYTVNCSGFRSVNSPKWTINAGFEQNFPLGNGGNIKLNGQTRYQSAVQTSYDFFARGQQEGYFISDAYVTYEAPDNKYFISAFVSNIEDTAAVTFTQNHPRGSVPLLVRHSLTPPRTYGVRAGIKF